MRPEILIPLSFVVIVITAVTIKTYNRFVKYRNRIEESWSGIDVALKRRSNLIPGLIKVIEGYSAHESKIFDEKTKVSAHSQMARMEQESGISKSISGLLAVAEAYPEIKASGNYLDLQRSLDTVEKEIQQARNRYNSYVGMLNILVESFPSSVIASAFHFEKQEYLALELATRNETPDVSFK